MRNLLSVSLVLLLLGGCSGEWLPFASGELEGTEVAAPADWTAVANAEVIQLETRPGEPYSVNLWVIGMNGALYVHAGANRATWVENIEANPAVRLGHQGSIYPLEATRILEEDEYARFSELYKRKYGNAPRNHNVSEVYFFRLAPRRLPAS